MQETDYKKIIQSAPFGFAYHEIVLDDEQQPCDYIFLEVNPAFEDLTGLKAQDIIHKKVTDIIPNIKNDSFDWIAYYGDIAINGGEKSFEQFSESLQKWYKVQVHSPIKNHFTTIFIDITKERKISEDLEGFFNVNLDLLCIADIEGNFIRVNKEWEKILGYSSEYLEKRKFLEFVHPDDMASTLEAMSALGHNIQVLNFTNRYLCQDGSYRFIEWRSHPQGNLIYAAARDVTERQNTELALQKSEEQLKLTLDATGEGIWDWDIPTSHVSHNVRWCEILGIDSERVSHDIDFFVQSIYPEDRDLVMQKVQDCISSGQRYESEHRMQKNDGSIVWVYDRGAVVQWDENGKPIRMIGSIADITEKKLYEIALRESEEQLKVFFSQSHAGIFFMMLDEPVVWNDRVDKEKVLDYVFEHQRMTRINRAMLEQYKAQEKDFLGMTPADFFAHNLSYGRQVWREFFDKGHFHFETDERRFDGTDLWVLGDYVCIYDKYGRIIGHFGIQSDITLRKNMEKNLELSEKNFRTFFETMDDMIFIGDQQGRIFYTNTSVEKKLQYTKEELMKMHILDVHPTDKQREAEEVFTEMFQGKRDVCPLPLARKDGSLIPVETRIWFGNWDGKDCIFGISKDLTKEQESLQMFNKLFNCNPSLLALTSISTGKFVEVNEAFLSTLGYAKNEIIGFKSAELNLNVDLNQKQAVTEELIKNGKIRNVEMKVRTKSGKVLTGLFFGEIIDTQNERFLLTEMTDITHLKQIEEDLMIAKEKAEAASKAKSEFLANMSHEIRTPLNGVIGFTDLLMQSPLNEIQKQYANNANTSGKALLGIINDILDFSKIEAGKMELEFIRSDLCEILENTIDIVKYQAEQKNLELLFNLSDDLPEYGVFDPVRLKQILINLLNNAIKFTEKGEVELQVGFYKKNDSIGHYLFSVRDTGIGISEIQKEKLFKAFSQADSSTTRRFGGTGLGLIISDLLAKKMGSWIQVDSEQGKGSVFYFEIETAFEYEERNQTGFNERTALVIDDNDKALKIIKKYLTDLNIKSVVFNNSIEAFQYLEKKPSLDFIFMDYHMPLINGVETLSKIRYRHLIETTCRVYLMINCQDDTALFKNASDLKIDGIIQKPIKFYDLVKILTTENQMMTIEVEDNERQLSSEHNNQKKTILIAEDVSMNLFLIRMFLQKNMPELSIIEATNGLQVLALMKENQVDMILMDIQMPEMDGIECTLIIREEEKKSGHHLPILALTAGALKEESEKCLSAGMDGFLTKPIQADQLISEVNKFLNLYKDNGDFLKEIDQPHEDQEIIHFNKYRFLEKISNDLYFYKQMLVVAKEIQKYIDQLGAVIEENNLLQIKVMAHKIRGSALNLHFDHLAELAGKMEYFERNTEKSVSLWFDDLLEEWEILIALINKELNDQSN